MVNGIWSTKAAPSTDSNLFGSLAVRMEEITLLTREKSIVGGVLKSGQRFQLDHPDATAAEQVFRDILKGMVSTL